MLIPGATSVSYTTPATSASDNGSQFTVTVSNSAGSVTSAPATLTENVPPSITTQPTSQTVLVGQTATFSVVAAGTTPLSYQWKKNGTQIKGATLSSYATPVTTLSNSGTLFSVTVTNVAGSVTSNSAVLTVNAPPSITKQPANQAVLAGQTATFSVTASGTTPLSYQWTKNTLPISGATSASHTIPAASGSDNGSRFAVTVTNLMSSVTSAAATLTVNVPPSITTQPASQTIFVGQTATFSVVAAGTTPLSYQWKKNGTQIEGATLSSYTTPVTTLSNSGTSFSVTLTNAVGSATSTAAIFTVVPPVPPSIASQPANQTVVAGQTATFSLVATGTAPLSYQWMENGAPIRGAMSSAYRTPPTTIFDSGKVFAVVVTNSGGHATSAAAAITVNAPGQLTASLSALNFGNVLTGTSSNLTISLTNTGGTSLTILNTTVSGAGFTSIGAGGLNLAPGQSTSFAVTFAPVDVGTIAGIVVLTSNNANSPTTIALSGAGVQPGSRSVSLHWTQSSEKVFGYKVYRATISGGPYTLVNLSPVTPDQYLDTTVTAGQKYYYVVTALDSMNNESTYSNETLAIIPKP
jgi:Abnormal spindle-like microcephaly-assoc'd, ASPM-SPD-2-Hydin/Immunoglobulin domain